MKVKFTNLYKLIYNKKFLNKIQNLIKNSRFSGGDEVAKFENSLRNLLEQNIVYVGNGTDALEIAIKSLNLKKILKLLFCKYLDSDCEVSC